MILHKMAATAALPFVAASGWAGYAYTQPDQNQYPSQMQCTTLASDISYNYQNNSNDVRSLQRFLVARGYMTGSANGYYDQATYSAVQRFQSDNGLSATGVVDSATRQRIQTLSCGGNGGHGGGYGNGQLSVQGIDAPSTLAVNQTGTWTVRVSGWNNYQGGQLHYTVVWGDENNGARTASTYYPSTSVNSTGTFTHVYVTPGTYTPVFTVTDDYGHRTQASVTTRVTAPVYGNGGYGGGYGGGSQGGSAYCNTYSGYMDRTCYANGRYTGTYNPNGGGYTGGTSGGYSGGYGGAQGGSAYCNTYSGYMDRTCYANGRYTGTYNPNGGGYQGGYQGGYTGGGQQTGSSAYCDTYAGTLDRTCYVNGRYAGNFNYYASTGYSSGYTSGTYSGGYQGGYTGGQQTGSSAYCDTYAGTLDRTCYVNGRYAGNFSYQEASSNPYYTGY